MVEILNRRIGAMPNDELTSRMDAVERLVELFRLERMVHLTVTTVSLVLLLGCAAYLIVDRIISGSGDWAELSVILSGLFGSSGLITFSTTRLLSMWNQALEVLIDEE